MPQTYQIMVEDGSTQAIESLEQLSDVLSVRQIRQPDINHKFDVGDYALDKNEPTPSPEANTVKIVDLIDKRAYEYMIEETRKTVAEHNPTYPWNDPVVVGRYPNMDPDKKWHFPESRLRSA